MLVDTRCCVGPAQRFQSIQLVRDLWMDMIVVADKLVKVHRRVRAKSIRCRVEHVVHASDP